MEAALQQCARAFVGNPTWINVGQLQLALDRDVEGGDTHAPAFHEEISKQLSHVDAAFVSAVARLDADVQRLVHMHHGEGCATADALAVSIHQLTAAATAALLLSLACIQQRNAQLVIACGAEAHSMPPLQLLERYTFSTCRLLSSLEASAQSYCQNRQPSGLGRSGSPHPAIEASPCPACDSDLDERVVLECGHSCCSACLLCTALCDLRSETLAAAVAAAPAEAPRHNTLDDRFPTPVLRHWYEALSGALAAGACTCRCPTCGAPSRRAFRDLSGAAESHGRESSQATHYGDTDAGDVRGAERTWNGRPGAGQGTRDDAESMSSTGSEQDSLPLSTDPIANPGSSVTGADVGGDQVLLPPRDDGAHHGDLTIVLDIDGTLVATFPPPRADVLPAGARVHHVAQGSELNPAGVLAMERPGLRTFLEVASQLGELAIFTAGVPAYALPIVDAIDPGRRFFGDRIVCREGTTPTPYYPCVKDLSRLGRRPERTVLVDDTPLAFLFQPDLGIPVLPFQGSQDDGVLLTAVLPLLKHLAASRDVRPLLRQQFDSIQWFRANGYVLPSSHAPLPPSHAASPAPPARTAADVDDPHAAPSDTGAPVHDPQTSLLFRRRIMQCTASQVLALDADHTLLPFNMAHRLVQQCSPELAPMLEPEAASRPPTSATASAHLDAANAVFREMHVRGVSVTAMLDAVRRWVREVEQPLAAAFEELRAADVATCILSPQAVDIFVRAYLQAAGMNADIDDVIAMEAALDPVSATRGRPMVSQSGAPGSPAATCITLRTDPASASVPCCPACASVSCKRHYLAALVAHFDRVLFVAHSRADACAISALRTGDVAFMDVRVSSAMSDSATCRTHAASCAVVPFHNVEHLARLIPCYTADRQARDVQ